MSTEILKSEKKVQIGPLMLKESQVEFLKAKVINRNDFFRLLLDGYKPYQDFNKKEKKCSV